MTNKVGVLVLHGIGTDNVSFDEEFHRFKNDIQKRLNGCTSKEILWEKVFWAGEINEIEKNYHNKIENFQLAYRPLRNFMINAVGDETAYRQGKDSSNKSIYDIVHEHVRVAMENLWARVGDDGELIIIAYSLGATIISDYIWDVQNNKSGHTRYNKFEQMKSIKCLFTMGSTLPLFLFSCSKIEPIEIDGNAWINYYDKDDILAYPIGVFDEYKNIVQDIEVNSGNFASSWNPLCHLGYFKSDEVKKNIAEKIKLVC